MISNKRKELFSNFDYSNASIYSGSVVECQAQIDKPESKSPVQSPSHKLKKTKGNLDSGLYLKSLGPPPHPNQNFKHEG